jgi:hypothetical protein
MHQALEQPARLIEEVEGSAVAARQREMALAIHRTLLAIAVDIRQGLHETIGIESRLIEGARCAVEIDLPAGTEIEIIAQAIELENVGAWCSEGKVCVGIGPWYTTKDVDQVVLCVTKVVHVLLGLHAPPPRLTWGRRALQAAMDIIKLQQQQGGRSGDAG